MPPRSRTVSSPSQMYCPSTRGTSRMKYWCPSSSVSHLPSGGSSTAPAEEAGWLAVPTPSTGFGGAAGCAAVGGAAAGAGLSGDDDGDDGDGTESAVRAGVACEQPIPASRMVERQARVNLLRNIKRLLLFKSRRRTSASSSERATN